MPELTAFDVDQYTQGRLAEGDPETVRLLAAGLSAARQFCGWHVTPVRPSVAVELDGPGGRILVLPTLKLVELTEVTEDGAVVPISDLYVSKRGLVRKKGGGYWSSHYGAITVSMEHGLEDAADFNAAVLSYVDRSSFAATGGRARVIGPFQYETDRLSAASAFSDVERSLLELYRLESPA
jgi:hypothetical protein